MARRDYEIRVCAIPKMFFLAGARSLQKTQMTIEPVCT
jgi:hypothetical protein